MQRIGYGRKIATCALMGFVVRLIGFAIESGAEGNITLNFVQYLFPMAVIIFSAFYLLYPNRIKRRKLFGRKSNEQVFQNSSQTGLT